MKVFFTFFLTTLVTLNPFWANSQEEKPMGQPYDWQIGFQEAASPVAERLHEFHNLMLIVIYAIAGFVTFLMIYVCIRFRASKNPIPSKTSHNTLIEIIWTVVPVAIVIAILIPSMRLLYYIEDTENADMTLKVIGYQWYWGYQYPDNGDINFESYMIPDDELPEGGLRLLEVDNRVILPIDTTIRIQVTGADVIHNMAVPALGLKMDAIPGRLNETWVKINKTGVYYGQCSELCGVKHGFMPIAIEAVSKEDFVKWTEKMKTASKTTGEVLAQVKNSTDKQSN